jgi:hypothetical protein
MSSTQRIIAAFGGVRALGRALGISHSSVARWRGAVPSKHQATILRLARERRLKLKAEDLIHE